MLTLMRIAGWIVMDLGRLLPRPSAGDQPRRANLAWRAIRENGCGDSQPPIPNSISVDTTEKKTRVK